MFYIEVICLLCRSYSVLVCFVAQPIHWNYKVEKLDALLKDAEEVAFWEPSANPYYKLPLGSQSCYGDQSFVILKSLVECNGKKNEKLKTSKRKKNRLRRYN